MPNCLQLSGKQGPDRLNQRRGDEEGEKERKRRRRRRGDVRERESERGRD